MIKNYNVTHHGIKCIYNDVEYFIDKTEIAESFERYGGSFLQAIGIALYRADMNNTERLLITFEDYVSDFLETFILKNKENGKNI